MRVGSAALYGFFGALAIVGGWFLGSLYETAQKAPMAVFGVAVWFVGLILALPTLLVFFVARPVRTLHRWVWAGTIAVSFGGFFRVWSWSWSLATAVVATMVVVIPRRERWRW